MIFIPNQEKLEFDAPSHTYTFEGQKLQSVSSIIHHYAQPFDPDGSLLAKKAAENGMSIKDQKAEWEKKGEDARNRGTLLHTDIENYIKTKKIPNTDNKKLVKQFSKIKFKGKLYSEVRLFHVKYGVAGTTDLIEILKDGSINLFDIKTNAKKKMSSFSFGRKMLYPLNRTWDSVLDKYSIQLSVYGYMLEEAGWWVNSLTILHADYDKQEIKEMPMENRRNDVINMLEHYRENLTAKNLPNS